MDEINSLVNRVKNLDREIDTLESDVKIRKREKDDLLTRGMLEAFLSNNIFKYESLEGMQISMKEKIRASLAEDRMPAILDFLKKYNCCAKLKREYTISIPLDVDGSIDESFDFEIKEDSLVEDEQGIKYLRTDLIDILGEFTYTVKTGIHANSVPALVKELEKQIYNRKKMVFSEELEAWTEEDTSDIEFQEDLDKLDTLLKQYRFFEASIKYVTRK